MKKSNENTANFEFANIVNGKFHVKCKPDAEGAIERKDKNDKQVFEQVYNSIAGVMLHDIEVKTTDFGKQLSIYLRDEDNKKNFFCINVQLNSGYALSFLSRAKNVDLQKPVEVKVFDIENKDENDETKVYKTKSIVIYQNGKGLEKEWTKENNPVPKAEPLNDKKGKQISKNGFLQWDSTAKEEFLEGYVEKTLQPLLKQSLKELYTVEKPVSTVSEVDAEAGTNQSDDLPF